MPDNDRKLIKNTFLYYILYSTTHETLKLKHLFDYILKNKGSTAFPNTLLHTSPWGLKKEQMIPYYLTLIQQNSR